MKVLTLLLLWVCPVASILSQSSVEVVAGPEWFDGSLLLNNGREIKGLIQYNDKTDIVSIENGRDSKSFTARHVKAFEFFDEITKKQRVFYSVQIEDKFARAERPLFFELLIEMKDFAVISKISPIHLDKKEYATPAIFNPVTGGFSAGRYYGYPSTISYTERLFLLSKDGELRPYLEITAKEIDGLFRDRSKTKNKVLDEEVLERFMSNHYRDLVTCADRNNLNLKDKNDFIVALATYKEIFNK